MAQISGDVEFILYGRWRESLMDRVEELKYLGPQLDQKDDNWTSI